MSKQVNRSAGKLAVQAATNFLPNIGFLVTLSILVLTVLLFTSKVAHAQENRCGVVTSELGVVEADMILRGSGEYSVWNRVKGVGVLQINIDGSSGSLCGEEVVSSNNDWTWVKATNTLSWAESSSASVQITATAEGIGHDCIVVTQDASFSPSSAEDCDGPQNSSNPAIAIVSPANTTSQSGTVSVQTEVNDTTIVDNVTFYVNGNQIGQPDSTPPYSVDWDTTSYPNSGQSLTAKLTDLSGNIVTSNGVNVILENTNNNDTTPPTVEITTPDDQVINGDSVFEVSVNISNNSPLNRVELRNSDTSEVLDTSITPPFTVRIPYRVQNGDFRLKAVAFDVNGNQGESNEFMVKIRNPDFDRGGVVNLQDLIAIISAWGTTDPEQIKQYDVSLDDDVGLADLIRAITVWGNQPLYESSESTAE